MKINVRINKDDNKTFRLVEFNASYFNSDGKLKLITDDIRTVKNMFSNLESVEVFINDNLVVETNSYDGYSSISYLGTIFCDYLNTFVDCLEVTLTKVNLVDEVERIKNIVEPVIDESSMDINQLKARRLSQFSEAGSQMIYNGTQVTLSSGETKTYDYSIHSQLDLDTYFNLFLVLPPDTDYSNMYVGWHSSTEICSPYTMLDIMIIFMELKKWLFRWKTYTNVLKNYVNSLTDIEAVRESTFGMDLPQEYQESMDRTMELELATIAVVQERLFPTPDPDDGEDNAEETE